MTRRLHGRTLRLVAAAGAVLLAAALAGCTENAPNDPNQPDGGVTEYQHPTTPVVEFSGPLLSDPKTMFRSSAYRGKVMVVNFWYAACGPCKAEADDLEALAKQYAGQAQFVGVNVRDDAGTASPFVQQYDVSYPVILDQQNRAAVQLAFASSAPTVSTPVTVVIGKEGRVTAVQVGQIVPSTMSSLIQAAVSGRDA